MSYRHPCHDATALHGSRSNWWNPANGPQAEQEHTLPVRWFGSHSLVSSILEPPLHESYQDRLRLLLLPPRCHGGLHSCSSLFGLCRHHPSLTLPSSSSLLDLSSPSLLPPCVLHSLLAYFQSPYLLTHHRNRQDSCHCLRRHPTFPYGLRSALFLNKPCS